MALLKRVGAFGLQTVVAFAALWALLGLVLAAVTFGRGAMPAATPTATGFMELAEAVAVVVLAAAVVEVQSYVTHRLGPQLLAALVYAVATVTGAFLITGGSASSEGLRVAVAVAFGAAIASWRTGYTSAAKNAPDTAPRDAAPPQAGR